MSIDRINYVGIAGTKYPLTFSLGAAKHISRKFGNLESMFAKLQETEDTFEQLDAVIFVLETLIKQGCAYLNAFEKDLPHKTEGTCFNGERYVPISGELIEVGIDVFNTKEIVEAISKTINRSSSTTVEVESTGEGKNEMNPAEVTETSGSICGVED